MILYKRDTKGKIRSLEIEAVDGILYQTSGLLDGAKIEHKKECKPKNVGKLNETDSQQQAISEKESLITKKLREGYFYTREEAANTIVILPMLAKKFEDEMKKINYTKPVYTQPKLDGMRCIAVEDSSLMSRKGVFIDTLGHLYNEINILRKLIGGIPDGELYAHGLDFQENMSLIKKYKKYKTESIMYHVYDMISDKPFYQRYSILQDAFVEYGFVHIELVPTDLLMSQQDLKNHHADYLNQGYEGTIIRHGIESYKLNGRSSSLLKYKDFIDITVVVKDVIPDDANPSHGSCIFEWKGAKGHRMGDNILGCGMKFSHKKREEILTDKKEYIGKTAELRFFEYSTTKVPRFPVCVGFRLDK